MHKCGRPCAHARLNFFRHSAIGCADDQERMCTRAGENVTEKRVKCINIQPVVYLCKTDCARIAYMDGTFLSDENMREFKPTHKPLMFNT